MTEPTSVRAVLFDYGHTLVDWNLGGIALRVGYERIRDGLVIEATTELPAAEELVDVVAGHVTRAVEESYRQDRLVELDILALFEEALSGLGFSPSPQLVRWVAEEEHRASGVNLFTPPEITQTLQTIHDTGLRIGIVSNAHLLPDMMRRDWDNLGFGHLVDASVVSCEIGLRKPHPEIFLTALAKLDVDPSAAVFVGDRAVDDVRGAHGVGMRAILTTQFRNSEGRNQSQEEIDAYASAEADLVVEDLVDILPFVLAA